MKQLVLRRSLPYILLLWVFLTLMMLRVTFQLSPLFDAILESIGLLVAFIAVVGYFTSRLLERLDLLDRSRRLAFEEGIEEIATLTVGDLFFELHQTGLGQDIWLAFDVRHIRHGSLRLFEDLASRNGGNDIRVLATGVGELDPDLQPELRYFFDLLQRLAKSRGKVEVRQAVRALPLNMFLTRSSVIVFAPLGASSRTILRLVVNPSGEAGRYYRRLYDETWQKSHEVGNSASTE